jgi:4-diphosphocytidyl-2C-methyl-D-erythritol kinase
MKSFKDYLETVQEEKYSYDEGLKEKAVMLAGNLVNLGANKIFNKLKEMKIFKNNEKLLNKLRKIDFNTEKKIHNFFASMIPNLERTVKTVLRILLEQTAIL